HQAVAGTFLGLEEFVVEVDDTEVPHAFPEDVLPEEVHAPDLEATEDTGTIRIEVILGVQHQLEAVAVELQSFDGMIIRLPLHPDGELTFVVHKLSKASFVPMLIELSKKGLRHS